MASDAAGAAAALLAPTAAPAGRVGAGGGRRLSWDGRRPVHERGRGVRELHGLFILRGELGRWRGHGVRQPLHRG